MAQVLTIAGENLFAIKAQKNEQLDIDTFVFAYVPGQDHNIAIDRNEGLPAISQRVHSQVVQQLGRVNDNVVIYSTVLDSLTGPFEFNWVGLYSSTNQTLVAISHIPTVSKTITEAGAAGNTLNRNFGIEYSGIAELTGVNVDPETWQIDYTARLNGMEELTRKLAIDMNGRNWFIDDGFKVVPSGILNGFYITSGAGYVSGLRVELENNHSFTVNSYPKFVYVDAWFDGTSESVWKGHTAFIINNTEMNDYVDANGKQHYVIKIARLTAANAIEDLRNSNGATQQCSTFNSFQEVVDFDWDIDKLPLTVSTRWYDSEGDQGHANYIIRTGTDNNGFNKVQINTDVIAELVSSDGYYYIEQFGALEGDYIHQILAGLLELELPTRARHKSGTFKIGSTVFMTDKSINIDLEGLTLLHDEVMVERVFLFKNNFRKQNVSILSVTYSLGRTRLSVGSGHEVKPGDKIKIYSNQNINPYSNFPFQRVAEFFVVDSVTSDTIVCVGKHIWAYEQNDNPRLAIMDDSKTLNVDNINITREIPHREGLFAVAIEIQGYYMPKVNKVYSDFWTGQLLSVRSCYRSLLNDISADELLDHAVATGLGYVGVDYGSQESQWYGLNGGKVRHTYTTGANSIVSDYPDAMGYGGAVRCHVYTGITTGSTNFAYDTHQDAWECEFHDIIVYDDYSTTESSSGGFQDRSQHNIVHKLTYISDGDNVSAGERAVMWNAGCNNSLIKEIVFLGRGVCLSSFGLDQGPQKGKLHCRVDKITAYWDKFAPRIARVQEDYAVSIGQIDIYPRDSGKEYYGSGGAPIFTLGGDGSLIVDKINLHFNNPNLPELILGSDYLANLVGNFNKLRININTFTNSKTYNRIERNLNGIRDPDSNSYVINDAVINWVANVDDWNNTMSRDGTFYGLASTNEIVGNLKYTYNVLADGVTSTDSNMSLDQRIFDANSHMYTHDKRHFGLNATQGVSIDEIKRIAFTGSSSSASVGSIDPPAFAGQRLQLHNLAWNDSGIITSVKFNAGCAGTDLATDRIMTPGSEISAVAYEKLGALVWSIPR